MTGLVIFLWVLLALLAAASLVILVMIIGLSRRINRARHAAEQTQGHIAGLMSTVSTIGSVAALFGGLKRKATARRRKSDD
ncbi:MAG: hypothetical protein Q4B05_01265 [Candidatus Saccharibacteria bacterium]|nr:hypothetical protein [Candidatus Saccharibacteria bacterium]